MLCYGQSIILSVDVLRVDVLVADVPIKSHYYSLIIFDQGSRILKQHCPKKS